MKLVQTNVLPVVPTADEECCLGGTHLLDADTTAALSDTLKALADPVRLRIFHYVATSCDSVCICNMPDVFGVTQPTLSHHLKRLVEAGLIHKEMRGRWAHFTPLPEGLAALRAYLTELPH